MPTFQTFQGVTFFAPSTIIDVQNELVEPSALEKSLVVFGDFPELKKGECYTSTRGGELVEDAYPNIPDIRNLSKLWKRSLDGIDGFAQKLSFVSAGTSTQAEFDIATLADAGVEGATFKSRYYGLKGNLLRVRLETPDTATADPAGIGLSSTGNYYRVISSGSGAERASREFGLPNVLRITYTDDTAGDVDATITIANGTIQIVRSTTDVTYQLDDFSSLDELVEAIEATAPQFKAVVLDYTPTASQLDEGVFTFNDDGAGNTPVIVNLHAHVYALKSGIDQLGFAVPYELELADDRFRHLAGTAGDADADPLQFEARDTDATASAATVADYREVLTDGAILGKDFTSCVVMDTNSSVHKLLQDYIETSFSNQKERNGFVPTPSNLSIDDVYQQYVKPRSSAQISVVAQDAIFEDYQNNRFVGDTTHMAFLAMAAHGALPLGGTATGKNLNLLETGENWNRELDIHQVAKRNIWGVKLSDANQLQVIRSLTSFVSDNLPQNNEVSVRESIDASSRDLRKFLSAELGSTIVASSSDKLKGLTETRLKLHRAQAIIQDFRDVKVSIVDDVAFISYDLIPTKSINFIRVTARIRREFE